jgi:hypothetical protein
MAQVSIVAANKARPKAPLVNIFPLILIVSFPNNIASPAGDLEGVFRGSNALRVIPQRDGNPQNPHWLCLRSKLGEAKYVIIYR